MPQLVKHRKIMESMEKPETKENYGIKYGTLHI